MTKFSIKKLKEKYSGASDAEIATIALKDYANKFAKQELPHTQELKDILEAFPLSYLDLKDKALKELILFSNEALAQNKLNIDEITKDKFLAKEATSWEQLRVLGKDKLLDSKNHIIDSRDVSISLLRLKFIENNWPKNKLTPSMIKQLKNAQVLLSKIDKLTYQQATSLGFGKLNTKGIQITPKAKDISTLIKIAESTNTINLEMVRDTYVSLVKGESKVAISFNNITLNKFKGQLSGLVNKQLEQAYTKSSKSSKTILSNLDVMNIQSSPSFLQDIEHMLTTALLGKKVPKRKRKSVSKTQYKLLTRQKVKNARKKLENKVLPKLPTIKNIQAGAELPLFNIRALINEALASQIQDNMGDSNDPPVLLRNQTGRFSESAKLLTLTRGQTGVLTGIYTYQKYPYQVFEPGHRLGTPKRNPKIYIEGSIRELALAIMKRKFPGLALELV